MSQPQPQQVLTRGANDALVKGQTRYMDTATAYDLWSEVYDTDGNFLQALDTIQMRTLLPRAASLLSETPQSMPQNQPKEDSTTLSWKAVDLGCGTGRNTLGLLDIPSIGEIVALDLSPKMLDVARQRCQAHVSSSSSAPAAAPRIHFDVFDMIRADSLPSPATNADLVVSTLVLEHVPLDVFFQTVAALLRPGGLLLLTNMHAEMGNISQAGFVDPKTGDKIRPVSYPHTVADTVEEAKKHRLEVIDGLSELAVDENMVESLGPRGKKWVGIKVWYGGICRKTG
ncbi:hypothetical protein H2198_002833 [Neophaeococcomyces mojaviensis]|uniref:Uncharacterized protein n=1 Tax=Neophaeococcomyces mojaviensis TaxID=3383035 RepID=A0ACC3AD01_9EURO|nr:hypothetical protein H2198_002833 [Knufia sp. JES_112]